jgi:hypothetical protein
MRILFLGDVHVGSSRAVFPEYYRNPETGIEIEGNDVQKELFRTWVEVAEKFAPRDSPPDVIILMGDLIDGPQRAENYHTLVLHNIDEQIDLFLELFLDYFHYNKIMVVRGTDYHAEVEGVHAEEWIARHLPNICYVSRYGSASQRDLRFDFRPEANVKLHAMHKVGVSSSPFYRATPLIRTSVNQIIQDPFFREFIEDAQNSFRNNYNLVARAHRHIYAFYEESTIFSAFITPSWQLPTEYAKDRDNFRSDIGVFEVEAEGDQIDFNKYLVTYKFLPHWVTWADVENNEVPG